ncbi:MAG TPA: TetR family transcriptional regulator [Rhodospirillales bacterium]|nr:TetR family transcriptional regulator [Rhodospirillales bacterium]
MEAADAAAGRLTEAALALAGERGWQAVSLVDVARRAELPLVACYRAIPDKTTLLCRLLADNDEAVLQGGPADPDETPRDRLFDVLMRRFDALQARRAGMVAILRELPFDPANVAALLPRLARSLVWMLQTAGIETAGLPGALRIKAVGVVYLYALRAWIDDDTPDMARTMAALDKALRRAEQLANRLPAGLGVGWHSNSTAAGPAADAPPVAPAST